MELDVGPDGLEIHWAQGNRPDDGLDDDLFNNRQVRNTINDETFTHPLLQQRVEIRNNSLPTGNVSRSGGDRSNGDLLDWQAFDDAVGGNALQILEQIFSRTRGRPSGSLRIVEVPSNLAAGGMARGAFDTPEEAEEVPIKDKVEPVTSTFDGQLSLLHSFNVYSTMDRWKQEMKLMYASLGVEKALRLSQKILNVLLPLAKEAADLKAKKEEEERLIREETARKREEELRKEEEKKKQESAAAEKEAPPAPANVVDTSDVAKNTEETATGEPERVTVSINGRDVDITGKR
jgi:E3 ubiquitin-protein ligase HUWE1